MKNYLDGGEAILERLRKLGITYIMSSPGSEWSPLWEALTRQKLAGAAGPTFLDFWHETTAVNCASGYTLITGRQQAVALHAGVGLMQGSMAIYGAQQLEIPMVVMAGESSTVGALIRSRDRAAMVRRPQRRRHRALRRSRLQMGAAGHEPVHLARERDPRRRDGAAGADGAGLSQCRARAHAASVDAAGACAQNSVSAQGAGARRRHREGRAETVDRQQPGRGCGKLRTRSGGLRGAVALADLLALPVIAGRAGVYASFPTGYHPLYLGMATYGHLQNADLVLLIGGRASWYPPHQRPTTGEIIAINENPVKTQMIYQNLHVDSYLEGDVATSLRLLAQAARAAKPDDKRISERRQRWTREHDNLVSQLQAARAKAAGQDGIDPLNVLAALADVMPANTIYVYETISHAVMLRQHLPMTQPQSFFRSTGGLGQSIGLSLGIKLASPERPVVLLVGDGSFLLQPDRAGPRRIEAA